MSSEVMNKWLKSNRFALIENEPLRPVKHSMLGDSPLSIQQGQAEVFFLENKNNQRKLLKKFYDHKRPDTSYLRTVSSILPKQKAFRCGTERRVLTPVSVQKSPDGYYSSGLADWIKDSVLMPEIQGQDWFSVIEAIRNRQITLEDNQRRLLCLNLVTIGKILEANMISHRDLSGGNIFIDLKTMDIYLIDLDSLYHPSLTIPQGTTIGSDGYTAPFVSMDKPHDSYCPLADRFAMALLCVEFLLINPSSPSYHEGGLFSQKELFQRYGESISYAESKLHQINPGALALFQKASKSRSFHECPPPDDWITICGVPENYLSVNDLPEATLMLPPKKPVVMISLPEDPWKNMKGKSIYELFQPSFNRFDTPVCGGAGRNPCYFPVENNPFSLESPVVGTNSDSDQSIFEENLEVFPSANITNLWEQIFRKY